MLDRNKIPDMPGVLIDLTRKPGVRTAAEPIPETIPEGKRNSTLTSLAGSMRTRGASFEAINAALQEENKNRCVPALPANEVEKIAASVSKYSPGEQEERERKKSQADLLIEIGQSVDELFHDDTGEAYVRIGGINLKLRSKAFKTWLSRECWREHSKAPNSDAINTALGVLEGIACFEGKQYRLDVRIAEHEGALYYDLCTDDGKAIKITPGTWKVVDKAPILFKRYPHQQPQVMPIPGGDVDKIFEYANVKQDDKLLFIARLIACFIPGIPRPIEVIHGEKGAAKTTTQKMERRLVDPSSLEIISFPTSINELVQVLAQHYYCAFDNVDHIPGSISDSLCRAVTGEGVSKRMLYTDDESVVFSYRRCIALNGINVVARRPDLLDRSTIIGLDRIPPQQRKEERVLWEAFEKDRPHILGGIFDILSKAMAAYPTIELTGLYRMADFTRWGCAIAKALEHKEQEFLDAYKGNISTQNDEVLSGSSVAVAIISLMENREEFEATPSDLYAHLCEIAEKHNIKTNQKQWPQAANTLVRKIKEIQSNLREAGITFSENRTNKTKYILFQKASERTVTTDTLGIIAG